MAAKNYHIMMFPWLAFGHMLPFLELSKKLATKGFLISYISTPKNIQRLPPIPSHLKPKISLIEIPIPKVDNLPQDCEATIDLPNNIQIQFLKKAYDLLAEPFENLLQNRTERPDLIVLDFAPYRISETAAKFGIKTAFFSVYPAATLAYLGPPAQLRTGKRGGGDRLMRNSHVPDASGKSSGQRTSEIIENCAFVLVRTCEEFEGEQLGLVQKSYGRRVMPVGLLPPVLPGEEECTKNEYLLNSRWSEAREWLDRQNQKSVVFAGFGSECKMPVEHVHELAFSLELSELPFIWVLREQQFNTSDLLPPGFTERTRDRGVVFLGWAPQLEILAHPAIGGCLFHAGWGTIIESLAFGHPLVLLPMVSDQGLNAKMLSEKGVGYEVPRNDDGSFSRDVVARSMRRVLVEPEGEQLRLKAAYMRGIFGDHKSQDGYIDKFIEYLEK